MGEEEPYSPYHVVSLTIGIILASWLLTRFGSLHHVGIVAACSAGVLLLIEAALLHGQVGRAQRRLDKLRWAILRGEESPRASELRSEQDGLEKRLWVLQPRERWCWRIGSSLVLVSVSLISLSRSGAPCPSQTCQTTVRFSDQVERALVASLATNPKPPELRSPASGEVKLDPKLETALWQHLSEKPAATAGTSKWVILALLVLAVALVAVIWWSLRDKPEATPLTLAIATLTAVSAAIERLSSKGGIPPLTAVPWAVIGVMVILALVGLALLVKGLGFLLFVQLDDKSIGNRSLVGSAFLVFGFSATLLALVPPMLLHRDATVTQHCPKCPAPGPMDGHKIAVFPLGGIDDLGDGHQKEDERIKEAKIHQLTDDLTKYKAQPDDILLLLGSADCVATRPKAQGGHWNNNEELANARADWVNNGLQGQAAVKDIRIKTLSMPQHARCGTARNVRAVYPFLIHAEGD